MTDSNNSFAQFLLTFQARFEMLLRKHPIAGQTTELIKACEYALFNGGKRVRPLIACLMNQEHRYKTSIEYAAIAIEYFHTASLIADDFPCMDDHKERRGKPALHKAFPENIALLASYALISSGYQKILHAAQSFPEVSKRGQVCLVALDIASTCAGIDGLTGGQFEDLFPSPHSLSGALSMIKKKTTSLFFLAFAFGWIFNGQDVEKLKRIEEISHHFGLAFQISDDLQDIKEDKEDSLNIVKFLGIDGAKNRMKEEVELFCVKMKQMDLLSENFSQLTNMISI